ncbi:hypothetical protein ACTXT7_000967 [Hymenolepis weldensis]
MAASSRCCAPSDAIVCHRVDNLLLVLAARHVDTEELEVGLQPYQLKQKRTYLTEPAYRGIHIFTCHVEKEDCNHYRKIMAPSHPVLKVSICRLMPVIME